MIILKIHSLLAVKARPIFMVITFFFSIFMISGCNRAPEKATDVKAIERHIIGGFQTNIYRVINQKQNWIEIAISIEGDKTFRMPVFFMSNGQFIQISDADAKHLIDKWIKARAESIAAFGTMGMQFGQKGPFVTIDRDGM